MALLRTKEIRAMRPEDIRSKFKELNDELMHERGVAAMGGAPASPGKIRAIRTNVARIHTIMREMHISEVAKTSANKEKASAKEEPPKAPKPKPKKTKVEKQKKEEQEEKK